LDSVSLSDNLADLSRRLGWLVLICVVGNRHTNLRH
jgi:hypothetical protein